MENPYEAFNYLNIGYSPSLYQISENGQSNGRIDAVSIASGENVSATVFESTIENDCICEEWVYIPYNFRQTDRIRQLQDELNRMFGNDINNEDIQKIWETGTEIDRANIRNSYKAIKGNFNTNSMTLYSGTKVQSLRQSIVNIIIIGVAVIVIEKMPDACIWETMMCLENISQDLINAYDKYWYKIGCLLIGKCRKSAQSR